MTLTRKRKWLSVLMVFAMLASFLVATAYAETTAATEATAVTEAVEENVLLMATDVEVKDESAATDSEEAVLTIGAEEEAVEGETAEEAKKEEPASKFFGTFWSLVPPVIAIILALITKEVYSSLFIGIIAGALLYCEFRVFDAFKEIFSVMMGCISDGWNLGILIFLVILGIMVCLMNKAGGSAAYGQWVSKKIKSKAGITLATVLLGSLIFIDDYFNCLTVGSVMRPATDKAKISRAKLAYIIDATAAPVCIIAPISSWAAAVSSYAPEGEGISLFIKTIPFNFYALLTIVMLITITLLKFDFGPMKKHEINAAKGDLFSAKDSVYAKSEEEEVSSKGKVIDLILPVIVLIISCVAFMLYTGNFFDATDAANYMNVASAFSNSDASTGLVYGSFVALIFTFLLYIPRRVIKFKDFADSIPKGFKQMISAILILIFAWTLSTFCRSNLGASEFVASIVGDNATASKFLPAIIFLIACFIAFSTGTSWGTFGILIPIVLGVFPGEITNLTLVAVSACLAGAVCGDHCSPISDTTIMSSSGAQCDHINHVSTQMPYALTVAGVSFFAYILAGFVPNAFIALPVAIAAMVGVLVLIKVITKKKA